MSSPSTIRCLSSNASFFADAPSRVLSTPPRVVVTGVGVVTALANDAATNWRRALARESAIERFVEEHLPYDEREFFSQVANVASVARVRVIGECSPSDGTASSNARAQGNAYGFDLERWSANGSYGKFVAFARSSANEALNDAGLLAKSFRGEDVGVSFGSGMGGTHDLTSAGAMLRRGELRRKISPFFVPRILANASAGRISMDFNARGPNLAASTACATSAHCVGEAFRALQRGDARVMIAGGAESCLDAVSFAAFAKARALSASGAARPFDARRDGFVMGEGAGALILETLEHARERGAKRVYAEVRGYGTSGDAYHVTRAAPDGDGAARAMRAALRDAGVDDFARDVGYVNAHATGTALGDAAETMALKSVFGGANIESGYVSTTSTKGATGHLLGAAGAVEAVYAVLALHTRDVPPTFGYDNMDDVLRIPLISSRVRDDARCVMSNSFGFGGVNASLVFAKPPPL